MRFSEGCSLSHPASTYLAERVPSTRPLTSENGQRGACYLGTLGTLSSLRYAGKHRPRALTSHVRRTTSGAPSGGSHVQTRGSPAERDVETIGERTGSPESCQPTATSGSWCDTDVRVADPHVHTRHDIRVVVSVGTGSTIRAGTTWHGGCKACGRRFHRADSRGSPPRPARRQAPPAMIRSVAGGAAD